MRAFKPMLKIQSCGAQMIHLYCDGCGPRVTPSGKAMGIGVFGCTGDEAIVEYSETIYSPFSTNNFAELLAIKKAFEFAATMKSDRVLLFSDSTFALGVTRGNYDTKRPHLVGLAAEVRLLYRDNPHVFLCFIAGKHNMADYYSRKPFNDAS